MPYEDFFDNTDEQSEAKCALIDIYYTAWAQAMKNNNTDYMTFLDLFAGSGRYGNGKISAPLKVLSEVMNDTKLKNTLVTVFNDKDLINIKTLEKAVRSIPGLEQLKYQPLFLNTATDDELFAALNGVPLSPCLSFVDLWGYKGITIKTVSTLLAGVWGCDCFFFFDYSRVKSGFGNPLALRYLSAIFGEDGVLAVKKDVAGLNLPERELFIVNAIGETLEQAGGKYVIPFRFHTNTGEPTSQYLFFVSKHYYGYDVMKDIIAIENNVASPYVSRFRYTPVHDPQLSLLYGFTPGKEKLSSELLRVFAGQFVSMRTIFSKHNRGTSYTKKDYQDALLELEAKKLITCSPAERKQYTMADNVMITFPPLPHITGCVK